jgi:hypothetical protein
MGVTILAAPYRTCFQLSLNKLIQLVLKNLHMWLYKCGLTILNQSLMNTVSDLRTPTIWTKLASGSIKATHVIIDKTKNIKYSTISGQQEWVSVIECISIDGTGLPPMVIFKGKTLFGR